MTNKKKAAVVVEETIKEKIYNWLDIGVRAARTFLQTLLSTLATYFAATQATEISLKSPGLWACLASAGAAALSVGTNVVSQKRAAKKSD